MLYFPCFISLEQSCFSFTSQADVPAEVTSTAWSQILLCDGEMTMLAKLFPVFGHQSVEQITGIFKTFLLNLLWDLYQEKDGTMLPNESLRHSPLSSVSENMPWISTNWLIMHWGDRLIPRANGILHTVIELRKWKTRAFNCCLLSSVGRALVCWAGGHEFKPQPHQPSGSLNNWEESAAFVMTPVNI